MQGLRIALDVPDLWQQEAVRALQAGRDVIIDAPTGAGKTRVFELFVDSGAAAHRTKGGQAVFTVPTRALANDKWREWKARGWNVGIATGDLAVNIHAPVLVATLETQRERILARRAPAFLVIDEYQMLADPRRGVNYELALALAPPETQFLLLSGSVRNPDDIAAWLQRLGRDVHLVRERERPVPLEELPVENLPRVLPKGVAVELDRDSWTRPAVFGWLQREGNVPDDDMVRTFNNGIGMAVVVPADGVDEAKAIFEANGETVFRIGRIRVRQDGEPAVSLV